MNTQDLVLAVLIAAGALAWCAFALIVIADFPPRDEERERRFRNQFDRTVEALKNEARMREL